MKSFLKFSALLLICLSFTISTFAQRAGSLDTTFNHTGVVYDSIPRDTVDGGNAMAIQSDGKIVVVGYTQHTRDHAAIMRFNTNGSIDTSFNKTGYVVSDTDGNVSSSFYSVVIAPNGKILVLGTIIPSNSASFNLERFNINGTLDTTFGNKGYALNSIAGVATSLVLLPNGKIVAGGQASENGNGSYFGLVQCDTTGKIDSTFGSNGIVTTAISSPSIAYLQQLAIQSNGKIIAAGYFIRNDYYFFLLARYTTNGYLDSTFGSNGIDTATYVLHGSLESVTIQPDNKIVAVGTATAKGTFIVLRVDSNGVFDATFGSNGIDTSTFYGNANAVLLQPGGKIIVGGVADVAGNFMLVRLTTNGTPDTSFGSEGMVSTFIPPGTTDNSNITSIALQQDGKIVAAGFADNYIHFYSNYFAIARYNNAISAGILNLSSTPNSILTYPNPVHNTETLDYTLTNDELLSIRLYDITGRAVKTYMNNEKVLTGEHKQQLSFENLPAGTYILTISNADSKKESVKVVKL